jgi:hypothetical protein
MKGNKLTEATKLEMTRGEPKAQTKADCAMQVRADDIGRKTNSEFDEEQMQKTDKKTANIYNLLRAGRKRGTVEVERQLKADGRTNESTRGGTSIEPLRPTRSG